MGQIEIFEEEIKQVYQSLFEKVDDLVLNPTFEKLRDILDALLQEQRNLLWTLETLIKQGLPREDLVKSRAIIHNRFLSLLNFLLWRLIGLSTSEIEIKRKEVPLYIDLNFAYKVYFYYRALLSFQYNDIVHRYLYLFGSARSELDDFLKYYNLLYGEENIYVSLFNFLPLFYEFKEKLVKIHERQKNIIEGYLDKAKNISHSYVVYLIGPAISTEYIYSGIKISEGITENSHNKYKEAEEHLNNTLEFVTSVNPNNKNGVVTLSSRQSSLPQILSSIIKEDLREIEGYRFEYTSSSNLGTKPSLIALPSSPDLFIKGHPSPNKRIEYELDSLIFIKKKLIGLTIQEIAQKISESNYAAVLKRDTSACQLFYNEGLEKAILREISGELKISLDKVKEAFDKISEVFEKHRISSRLAVVLALHLAHYYAKTHGLELSEVLDQIMPIIIDIIVLLFPTGEK